MSWRRSRGGEQNGLHQVAPFVISIGRGDESGDDDDGKRACRVGAPTEMF